MRHAKNNHDMPSFEIIDTKSLAPKALRSIRRRGFYELLRVAANRWMEGLPMRVVKIKK